MTPGQGSSYYGEELLPLNGYLFGQLLMGLPLMVEPLSLEVGSAPKTSRRICV